MDSKRKLFRQAALDKRASLERLDESMEVTAPAGWIALVALAMVLAAAVLWSIYGRIPIQVHGQGILIRGGEVLEVTSGHAGRLTEMMVERDDFVEVGQTVALIRQPDLQVPIENTEAMLETLRQQSREQNASSKRIVAQLRIQKQQLEGKVRALESLQKDGLAGSFSILDTNRELSQLDQAIAEEEARRAARRNRIEEVERELVELKSQLLIEEPSRHRGRVTEVTAARGDLVKSGTRLLTLEADEAGESDPDNLRWHEIKAVIYVPAAEGKRIEEGKEARVSPSTEPAEEFGLILGEVYDVSSSVVTTEGMARTLRNDKLVETLSAGGPVIEVKIRLHRNPVRQFKWTTSEGPPREISTGTPCSAFVILEQKSPVSYFLPGPRARGEG